ncbi:hypothetical protein [Aerosakkonema funiforme]|uniref:Uncharacterized protein n=1 Tax=Aerosakkonema funiforme FACHB-1375 TaxID=2949571 RepID=A0A926VES2_9CYAN|nr:hypothetical protein [Aerosakkonema funiforme]MBD2182372.1 hypothetical protein [Aerosakkonema funiforme FACHB-1375]
MDRKALRERARGELKVRKKLISPYQAAKSAVLALKQLENEYIYFGDRFVELAQDFRDRIIFDLVN